MKTFLTCLIKAALLLLLTCASAGVSHAQEFVVTNNLDSGPGSLREAISNANVAGGTILFSNVTGTIALTNGQLTVSQSNVDIIGPGPTNLVLSGNYTNRIFYLTSTAAGAFSGLAIENGYAQGPGGGICNFGNLVLGNCVVANCSSQVSNVLGGGIYNGGILDLSNCVITSNSAFDYPIVSGYETYPVTGVGGGIYNQGKLTAFQTRISENECITKNVDSPDHNPPGGEGGGIYNSNSATIIESVISDNASGPGFGDSSAPTTEGGDGGGIYNTGSLTIVASTIMSNITGFGGSGYEFPGGNGGNGAGIWNGGQFTMTSSSVMMNYCGNGGTGTAYINDRQPGGGGGGGSGTYNVGVAAITNCLFVGNICGNGGNASQDVVGTGAGFGGPGGDGGAIFNQGALALCNSTLYSNLCGSGGGGSDTFTNSYPGLTNGNGGNGGRGGGLWNQGSNSTLVNCTISSNLAGTGGSGGTGTGSPGLPGTNGMGGGIGMGGGTVQILNTLVASNSAPEAGPDVYGNFTSEGHNLIGNVSGSSGFGATGDLLGVNPLLGPLANNGGPTLTCALLPGSPAIDAGDDSVTNILATDQRGYPRLSGAHVDIGAYELQGPYMASISASAGFVLTISGLPGDIYQVQASPDMLNWQPIGTVTNISGVIQFTDSNSTNFPTRFYRVVTL